MSNESTLKPNRSAGPALEWLESGWILELALKPADGPESKNFLIGGGLREALNFDSLESAKSAVWAPDFFPNQVAPFTTAWSQRLSRAELLSWLSENFPGSITSSKIHWQAPQRASFDAAFRRIRTAFSEDGVKKAVPAIFASGLTATSDRPAWLAQRLRGGLEATSMNKLRLYGLWSFDGGFLGATPEALFTREGGSVSSMAVAGTRALNSVDSDPANPNHLAEVLRDFERDPKELHEHDLVVRDISTVFSHAGVSVTRSETRVEKFGTLFHLVTDFASVPPSAGGIGHAIGTGHARKIVDWVRAFHPTPALGTSPRDPDFKLLLETHGLSGDGNERGNFGAPFIVKIEDRVEALVAIRQIRWRADVVATDRLRVTVGSGCGIVPESDADREWSELAAKRDAVLKMFRLSPEESRPVFWSLEILQKILDFGVRRFVVCAGARNAPLVVALEALRQASNNNLASPKIVVESFFEERAAAFYALGLARSSRQPVAVVTTSGTAVTELLPAMAEADFSGIPLVSVTADRPRRLRTSGAPQSIPQDQIFHQFVEQAWDLEEGDVLDISKPRSGLRPLHFNICLEEPLLRDAELAPELLFERAVSIVTALTPATVRTPAASSTSRLEGVSVTGDHSVALAAIAAKLKEPRLMAIIGGLQPEERDAVAEFLNGHRIPCLLEAPSGLRGDSRLASLELTSGDRYLQKYVLNGAVEHVLRIGGVPTTRVWRDLDEVTVRTQTLSISRLRFSGLGRGQFVQLPGKGELVAFLKSATQRQLGTATETSRADWIAEDRAATITLENLLRAHSTSEAGFVRRLSEQIPNDAIVYVGNSLPIRWWDLAATRLKTWAVEANRGVNGIDGQLSTAFGLAAGIRVFGGQVTDTPANLKSFESPKELWVLVGDLTAMYDLAAPWALVNGALATKTRKVRIVVLNNSGGRIFTRVLAKAPGGSAPFENQHALDFKNWAAMWKLGYARVMNHDELSAAVETLEDHSVIEIVPSEPETRRFWTELP